MTAADTLTAVDTARLEALRRYDVREDLVHADLDGIARLAAFVAGTESAAVFLPGRDGSSIPGRVVATHGCSRADVSRSVAEQHPLAVAADLMTADGHLVGTLLAFGDRRGNVDLEHRELLADLADQAMALLELRRMAHTLARMTPRDPVTGLANRRSLEHAVAAAIGRAERGLGTPSVVAVDLNSFAQVNDVFGRESGDALLREVADRLTRTARGVDTVARLGSDDFAVLLEHTGGTGATAALGRMRASVEGLTAGAGALPVTAVLGVATYRPGDSVASLLSRADAEMYAEKTRG
jgi:diguanylate cyclase (GGDEF)-like protein